MRTQEVFRALADPTRREILKRLKRGSLNAGELADMFPMTKASMSHHFNVLKAAELVRCERRGKQQVYAINTSVFEEVAASVLGLLSLAKRGTDEARRRRLLSAAFVVALSGWVIARYVIRPEWMSMPWTAHLASLLTNALCLVAVLCVAVQVIAGYRAHPAFEQAEEVKDGRIQPLSVGLILASFVLASVMYYCGSPEGVAAHWNAAGGPDYFTPRWNVFIIPSIMAFVWLVSVALPSLSPRGFGLEPVRRIHEKSEIAGLSVFFLASIASVGVFGPAFHVIDAIMVGMGVGWILLGNVMGKLPQNDRLGIRTPWTYASAEVWLRTQRLGGRVLMAAGTMLILADLAGAWREWFLPILSANVAIPTIYSYFLSRRLGRPRTE